MIENSKFKSQNSKTTHSPKALTMAELMQKQAGPVKTLHRGDKIQGKITKLTSSEILLDINYKTEAVVLEKDRKNMRTFLSLLHVGDDVTATVLTPESDRGNIVVSLRQYVDNEIWGTLKRLQKEQKKVSVFVKESTKGGFLVEDQEGLSGFLPNSHVSHTHKPEDLVGKTIEVLIVELNPEQKKVIFSQKATVGVENFLEAVKTLKVGQKVTGVVSGITSFGIFISVEIIPEGKEPLYLDSLIHMSEISWDAMQRSLTDLFTMGEKVEAVIIGFDEKNRRIELSIKRLTKDPFEETAKQFSVDKKVLGTIRAVTDLGLTVSLEAGNEKIIEGFIKKEKIPPSVTYTVGQKINVVVSQVDTKKRKILLLPVLLEKPMGYR